jgi:predicted RNase H-like HicB family nuclease
MSEINANLWNEAEIRAKALYDIIFDEDILSGELIYMARHPELPGCKAHGATQNEASQNLEEARIDYIYALLVQGLPIPEPSAYQQTQTYTAGVENATNQINFPFQPEENSEVISDEDIKPAHRQTRISYPVSR